MTWAESIKKRLGVPPWVVAIALATVVIAGVIGWALATMLTSHQRASSAPAADQSQTAEQAKSQACNAFAVAGRQWSDAHRQWLPVVSTPGWTWSDPAVRSATETFSATATGVAAELTGLVGPNTPTDVARAIHGYTNAVLEFSAGHYTADAKTMAQQETQISAAAADVGRACA